MNKPFETNYPKWRHRQHGYIVEVLSILHNRSDNGSGYYSQVIVRGSQRSSTRKVAWSAEIFRKNFEPHGRKKKPKTAMDHLLEDD